MHQMNFFKAAPHAAFFIPGHTSRWKNSNHIIFRLFLLLKIIVREV